MLICEEIENCCVFTFTIMPFVNVVKTAAASAGATVTPVASAASWLTTTLVFYVGSQTSLQSLTTLF